MVSRKWIKLGQIVKDSGKGEWRIVGRTKVVTYFHRFVSGSATLIFPNCLTRRLTREIKFSINFRLLVHNITLLVLKQDLSWIYVHIYRIFTRNFMYFNLLQQCILTIRYVKCRFSKINFLMRSNWPKQPYRNRVFFINKTIKIYWNYSKRSTVTNVYNIFLTTVICRPSNVKSSGLF